MGKNTQNPAKTKGYEHPQGNRQRREQPQNPPRKVSEEPGEKVMARLDEAVKDQGQVMKEAFYAEVMQRHVPMFAAILVNRMTQDDIASLIADLEAKQEFHEEAAAARQLLQALKVTKSTVAKNLETACPEFVQRQRQTEHLENIMKARGRYIGGVAIPAWAPGSPELATLETLTAKVKEEVDAGFAYLDQAIEIQKQEMDNAGYTAHLAEQDKLWDAARVTKK